MIASIVIPTYRRNDSLMRAVRSCFNQCNVSPEDYELVVVDNCPNKTAEGIVKEFTGARPPVVYVSEPRQGVVFARNTGISMARGDYIAFLDDDEYATPNWLAELLKLGLLGGAAAVFGPVRETVDDELKHIRHALDFPIVGRYFDRADGDDISDCLFYLGTGNSLFNRTRCFGTDTLFDQRFNFCGGEDIDLLSRLRDQNVRFVWAAHAWVDEHVPAERLTMRYLMKRRFHSGQIRTLIEAKKGGGRLAAFQISFWMAVGGMQLLYYSVGFLVALARRRDTLNYAARIAGGAGKLLFFFYPNTANG